ncbi:hypothetical protein PFISCL1PPCAC_21502, partial [Pristionchus fissidentatus]
EEEKKEEEEGKDEDREGEEKDDEDMENMDKNERENKEELEGKEDGEKEEKGGEEMEEDMELGEDAVDKEEEEGDDEGEEDEDGKEKEDDGETKEDGEEEKNEEEEQVNAQMSEEIQNGEEEKKEEEKEATKMDSGYGGEKNEEENEEGGGAEREEVEDEEKKDERGEDGRDDKEKKKEGKMKSDKGEEEKKKEEERNEEGGEEKEKEEAERKREIVVEEDEEMEEESEMVEGNEEEHGDERKESNQRQENDRMMSGAGTMEEAKESAKRREDKKMDRKNEKVQVSAGMAGEEETEEEGQETMINFNPMDLMELTEKISRDMVMGTKEGGEELVEVKEEEKKEMTEQQMDKYRHEWEKMAPVVSLLAAELSENLRLILEPRVATRMEGDYRSGKRLNMKRIIPYIASQYRKNRIWMKRTKKAERNYEVLIAVDDSASMAENGMESLTCQGVCIVEEALRRVNAGQLSVMTFGEGINQVIPFAHAASTQTTGESLLSALSFDQSSTDMCGMLRKASALLEEVATAKSEQMLIIISDGRGALANGVEKIRHELSRLSRVAVLFVILDCGKKSIKEMRVASFVDDQVQLIPYLSLFPFPLYVLAQSVNHIPSLLSEALRQWIEYGGSQ